MASDSKPDFDPYYEWLGIPPAEQPPNLYRLLGLQKFESDPDVIENAADRQMLYLRQLQSSPRWPYAEAILRAIARTKVELLDPHRRQVYDRFLQQSEPARAVRPIPIEQSLAPAPAAIPLLLADPQTAPEVLATPSFQSAARPADSSSPSRRRNKPVSRNGTLRLVGVILGGPMGIMLGIYLAKVLLGIDVLELAVQPKKRPPKVVTQQQPVKVVPQTIPSRPRPMPEPRPFVEPAPAARPSVQPNPAPSEPSRAIKTEPVVTSSRSQILAALPPSVDLPPASNSAPVVLFSLAGDASLLEWTLKSEAADLPAGGVLFCRPTNNETHAWNFQYAPDAAGLDQGVIPIARLQAMAGAVQFQWTTASGDEPIAVQLCNCILEAKSGTQTHRIQLRRVETLPRLALNVDQRDSSLDFELANPPRQANLSFEITATPKGGTFEDGVASANVNKPVVVQFAELKGAELSLLLQRKPKAGQFSVRATPEFSEGPRLKYELTRPKLGEMTKRWTEMGQKAAVTIKQTQARIAALQSQLDDVSGTSGNISVMVERNRQMTALRDRIKIEVERLPTHHKRLLEAEARLKAAPSVESFLAARDQAPITFRVFAQAGQERIVLAESQ